MTRLEVLTFINWLEIHGYHSTAESVRVAFADLIGKTGESQTEPRSSN